MNLIFMSMSISRAYLLLVHFEHVDAIDAAMFFIVRFFIAEKLKMELLLKHGNLRGAVTETGIHNQTYIEL